MRLTLTLAVLLAATGAASMTHGLGAAGSEHRVMEGHGQGHVPDATLEDCCDAAGAAIGGCLIDAPLSNGLPPRDMAVSSVSLTPAAPSISPGRAAPVPTGPPKA